MERSEVAKNGIFTRKKSRLNHYFHLDFRNALISMLSMKFKSVH